MKFRLSLLFCVALLTACVTPERFYPRSDYPTDPWVRGYTQTGDCLGGEAIVAKNIPLPDYPKRAFNGGRQGWTIVKLDVDADGNTENVTIERSVPEGVFGAPSLKAVKGWTFFPPRNGPVRNCRMLLRYKLGAVSLAG